MCPRVTVVDLCPGSSADQWIGRGCCDEDEDWIVRGSLLPCGRTAVPHPCPGLPDPQIPPVTVTAMWWGRVMEMEEAGG